MTNDTKTKNFNFYIVLNLKNGQVKTRKTRPNPRDVGEYTRVIEQDIDVEMPEPQIPTVSSKLKVPETEIKEMVSEEIELIDDESDFGEFDAELVCRSCLNAEDGMAEMTEVSQDAGEACNRCGRAFADDENQEVETGFLV